MAETKSGIRLVAILLALMAFCAQNLVAENKERRAELGIQLGMRFADQDIVPEDSLGLGATYGVEFAWAFNHKWGLFSDLSISKHDSKIFYNVNGVELWKANNSKHHILRALIERRFQRNQKNGHWYLGVGTGIMDIEWRGFQIHRGLLSIDFGRRAPFGPGYLRVAFRADLGIGSRTDRDLGDDLKRAHFSEAAVMVGWGWGFGKKKNIR